MFTTYYPIDKQTLCKILNKCEFCDEDELLLYPIDNTEDKIVINLNELEWADSVFTIDIGFVYLILDNGNSKYKVEFTNNGTLNWEINEDLEVPDGYTTVVLAIKE